MKNHHTMKIAITGATGQLGRLVVAGLETKTAAAGYAATLTGFGLPEGLARLLAGSDVDASKGALFDDSRQLSGLLGRPTTPLPAAVKEALRHV